MGLIVHKYGGTSVGDLSKIKGVAQRIAEAREAGDDIVVVVSAMAGETDRLIGLASQICDSPSERELDLLLSSGERISCSLLTLALQDAGYKAEAFTGRQVGIVTDSAHTKARIKRITADRVKKAIEKGQIPVVAGFQGIDESENVTTLGRGGSDTTAVALAAALNANMCIIYTDVDGVYTADPNIVTDARRLDKISYDEMLELASLGAKVLHTRSVEFAKKYEVALVVRSTFKEGKGTMVAEEDRGMEAVLVSGVAYDKNQAKITISGVPDQPGIAGKIFSRIAENEIVVDMIIQNVSGEQGLADISFTVLKTEAQKALKLVEEVTKQIGGKEVQLDTEIAKVSIVGVGMRSHSGVASRMFNALAEENINIMMISTSEIKISCVIEAKYTELAVRILHKTFGLENSP
jgi:aspartate kinase